MKTIRTAIRILSAVAAAAALALFSLLFYLDVSIHDRYYNRPGEEFSVATLLGAAVSADYQSVAAVDVQTDPPVRQAVTLRLFGCIPIKTTAVSTVSKVMLAPCGTPFGVKLLTDGVLVVGLNEIATDGGNRNPAKEAGLLTGDLILSVDGSPVTSNDALSAAIRKSGGNAVSIRYRRDGRDGTATLRPVLSAIDGGYKAGLWVRDSSAGIGTVSFYDPVSGAFGGLGHAICDVDTGEILPVLKGDVVPVNIHGIVKGTVGTPGELCGSFSSSLAIGAITLNNESGVFGTLRTPPAYDELVPMGLKQEIHSGKATVLTTVSGQTPKSYAIEIERVSLFEDSPTKNMVIRITDPELLEKTGGIVQGMSGSPILQDGKLIGAVTHVFVNDPTRGYAIFAENMLETAQVLTGNGKTKDAP